MFPWVCAIFPIPSVFSLFVCLFDYLIIYFFYGGERVEFVVIVLVLDLFIHLFIYLFFFFHCFRFGMFCCFLSLKSFKLVNTTSDKI